MLWFSWSLLLKQSYSAFSSFSRYRASQPHRQLGRFVCSVLKLCSTSNCIANSMMISPSCKGIWILCFVIGVLLQCSVRAFIHFDVQKKLLLRDQVKEMFYHAYDAYLDKAFPLDELRPLTCDGVDTWGSYSLTLIDALDTLAVMGNHSEFRRVVSYLSESLNFDKDVNVSVFETNIRIVGGLLSAHLLSKRAGVILEDGWPCSGPLLRLAEDIAQRILPAFRTNTGMPYGTVNLRYGVPPGETPVTCTSGVTTFILEFGVLSRLTGNPDYEETAMRALRSLWHTRSVHGLVGNHIDVETGQWKAIDAGIGAGVDSYYEYLAKAAAMFQNSELMATFLGSYEAIEKHINHDDWYFWVSSTSAHITMAVFQSLEAFWPGVLASIGDAAPAYRSLLHYLYIWRHFGGTPEFFDITKAREYRGREGYPLRPELIESIYHFYQVNKDPLLLQMGAQIMHSINHIARVPCGFATVKNIRTHSLENRMESFFLAETLKYLYLLFDEENFIHHDNGTAEIHESAHGDCILSSGSFVFNTEAHPFDISATQCCSTEKKEADEYISKVHRGLDIPFLLQLNRHPERFLAPDTDFLDMKVEENVGEIMEEFAEPPPLVAPEFRTFEEYCNCDIPLPLYGKVCATDLLEFLALDRATPARFCAEKSDVLVNTPVFQSDINFNDLPPVYGSPNLLVCPLDNDLDFSLYGEINPRW